MYRKGITEEERGGVEGRRKRRKEKEKKEEKVVAITKRTVTEIIAKPLSAMGRACLL